MAGPDEGNFDVKTGDFSGVKHRSPECALVYRNRQIYFWSSSDETVGHFAGLRWRLGPGEVSLHLILQEFYSPLKTQTTRRRLLSYHTYLMPFMSDLRYPLFAEVENALRDRGIVQKAQVKIVEIFRFLSVDPIKSNQTGFVYCDSDEKWYKESKTVRGEYRNLNLTTFLRTLHSLAITIKYLRTWSRGFIQ